MILSRVQTISISTRVLIRFKSTTTGTHSVATFDQKLASFLAASSEWRISPITQLLKPTRRSFNLADLKLSVPPNIRLIFNDKTGPLRKELLAVHLAALRNLNLTEEQVKAMGDDQLSPIIDSAEAEIAKIVDGRLKNIGEAFDPQFKPSGTINHKLSLLTELYEATSQEKVAEILGIPVAKKKDDINVGLLPFQDLEIQFRSPIDDPLDGLGLFSKAMSANAQKWSKFDYYSPYTALVQASGTGKSRMLLEYGKRAWAFYICLRPHCSTGFPPRSPIADVLLENNGQLDWTVKAYFNAHGINEGLSDRIDDLAAKGLGYTVKYVCFLSACVHSLHEYIENCKKDKIAIQEAKANWISSQVFKTKEAKQFWDQIAVKTAGVYGSVIEDAEKMTPAEFSWEVTVLQASSGRLAKACEMLRDSESEFRGEPAAAGNRHELPVLFAFDEASAFVRHKLNSSEETRNAFDYLRYALHFLPEYTKNARKIPFFGLFTDTMGSLANFSPTEVRDPSLRFIRSNRLFEPYWALSNWNFSSDEPAEIVSVDAKAEHMANSGRALWQATYRTCKKNSTPVEALSTLVRQYGCPKLIQDHPDAVKAPSHEQMLAVIGSRLALNFSATSKLSHELSRAYMAVCYGVEASRNMSVVGYPSEPVLALASQELMRRDAFSWKNISAHVIQSLQNGWVEEGPRGEFAWQIMAAEAWDRCTADDETARITGASIGNFFRALIGPDNVKKIEEQASECGSADKLDAVFRAPTHFLQFVEVESSPTIEKLQCYSKRPTILRYI